MPKPAAEHTHIMITEPINAVKVLPPIGGEASPVGSGLEGLVVVVGLAIAE